MLPFEHCPGDTAPKEESNQCASLLDESRSLFKRIPGLLETGEAVSARGLYLGLTDQLHTDSFTMRRALESLRSPVAKQLIASMDELKAHDWQYLRSTRAIDYVGCYHQMPRQISYTVPRFGMPAQILGVVSSPIKRTATLLAHEVGHHTGPLYDPAPSHPKSPKAFEVAKACLESEARVMLIEAHIAGELGVSKDTVAIRKPALMSGTLGSAILESHKHHTVALQGQPEVANKIVNDFLREKYPNVIDPKTGTIRPFKIECLPEPPKGPSSSARPVTIDPIDYRDARRMFNNPGTVDSELKSKAIRCSKALAAAGVFVVVNDVYGAFQKDKGSGFGRVAKVATEWGGFEATTFLARSRTEELFFKAPKTRCSLVLGAGILGAYSVGKLLGEDLEQSVKKALNDQKRPLSLKDYH